MSGVSIHPQQVLSNLVAVKESGKSAAYADTREIPTTPEAFCDCHVLMDTHEHSHVDVAGVLTSPGAANLVGNLEDQTQYCAIVAHSSVRMVLLSSPLPSGTFAVDKEDFSRWIERI